MVLPRFNYCVDNLLIKYSIKCIKYNKNPISNLYIQSHLYNSYLLNALRSYKQKTDIKISFKPEGEK